jgi:iron complex outermembrane receptor protein
MFGFRGKWLFAALFVLSALGSAMPVAVRAAEVETVVVTAERRNENLQSAAVAASVLTENDLKAHDIRGVDDLEFATPSITIGSNGQSTQINIRGIGKEDNSGNATSSVAIYRDGIGVISGFATNEPYYDVNTVEVLRGPQGTFSGENAAGGAIFINTRDPDFKGGYSGYIEAGYGNYNEIDAQGAINLPLTDTFAARIAFDHVNRDSFYTVWFNPQMTIKNPNPVGARDYNSVRLGLLWQPIDDLEVKFKFDYNNLDNHGYAFSVVPGWPLPGSDDFLNCPCAQNLSSDPFVIGNNATDNYAKDENARGALDVRYTLPGGLVLRSLTGEQWLRSYIRNDDDGSAFVDRRQHINATWNIFSEELTLASPDTDPFNWIVGAYYKKEILKFPRNDGFYLFDNTHYDAAGAPIFFPDGTPIPGAGPAVSQTEVVLLWRTPRTTESIFGQVEYAITDKLKAQFGLRAQHFITTEESDLSLPIFGIVLPTYRGGAGANARGGKGGYGENTLTGKFALNYQMTDTDFFYAFIATGTTTGGVNVVIGIPNYKKQETTDIEGGWKAQWLDNQIFTQIGGFYDFINNYQAFLATNCVTVPGGGPGCLPVPGGAYLNLDGISTIYGLEATGQAVFGNFSMDAALALIHSELGSADILAFGLPFQTKGKPQPFTPEVTFHFGAQYAFPFEDGSTLTPRADVAFVGRQTLTPIDAVVGGIPLDRVPEHTLLNLKLTYGTERWNGEFYVTNVTDEAYIEAHGGPGYNAYVNEPRRIGVRLHYNY